MASSSFFRSQTIEHYKLILPRENAWQIMNMLGQLNLIHIVPNKSPILAKPFTQQIRRCEECLQKIYGLQQALVKKKLYMPKSSFTESELNMIAHMISHKYKQLQKDAGLSILDDMDDEVDQHWKSYEGHKKRYETLHAKLMFYRENIAIIKAGEQFFGIRNFASRQQVAKLGDSSDAKQLIADNYGQMLSQSNGLTMKCGIIQQKQQARFSRTIFRISRGNCFLKFISLKDTLAGEPSENVHSEQVEKSVYFVLVPAKADSYFDRKLSRLINSHNNSNSGGVSGGSGEVQAYRLPNTPGQYQSVMKQLQQQHKQTEYLISLVEKQQSSFYAKLLVGESAAQEHRFNEQASISNSVKSDDSSRHSHHSDEYKHIQTMKVYLIKQLQIFTQLNEMQLFSNFLQAEIYIRKSLIQGLQLRLTNFEKQTRLPSGHLIPIQQGVGSQKKPTLFHTNSFTVSAQEIVQTYGVAQYKQANPALFTTITFPFLFGVMFGDIGHGAVLLAFGLLLVFAGGWLKRNAPVIAEALLPHKYLFALMGFFATYCGFIYNDFLSMDLNLFGSCYDIQNAVENKGIARSSSDCVYPFGIDPVWAVAENNLNFLNSLKMKISVIIAVVHMTLGVLIKAFNAAFFRRKIQLIFEFIPQLLFLVLVFGYMDFLIVYKWLKDWGFDSPHAPSIITSMINLPLALGKTDTECCHGGEPMWGQTGNSSQDQIQQLILFIAVVSIPVMLLVKPIYQILQMRKHHDKGQRARNNISDVDSLEEHFEQLSPFIPSQKHENILYHDTNSRDMKKVKGEIEMMPVMGSKDNRSKKNKGSNGNSAMSEDFNDDENFNDELSSPAKSSSSKQHDDNHLLADSNNDSYANIEGNQQQQHQPSEIMVHQIIQTIEFVLGCISNTASYLRLWALSLAHSQLSEVFLQKTVQGSIISGYAGIPGVHILLTFFKMILLFPAFVAATFGVLMCMDVMECFLHTLRLHWVEFQNKFYKGDGYEFVAFNFVKRINYEISKGNERYQ